MRCTKERCPQCQDWGALPSSSAPAPPDRSQSALLLAVTRHWESYAKAEIRQLRKALEAQQAQQEQQQQEQQQGGAG